LRPRREPRGRGPHHGCAGALPRQLVAVLALAWLGGCDPLVGIRGRIRSPDQRPVAGATAFLIDVDQEQVLLRTQALPDGAYNLGLIGKGAWAILIWKPGYVSHFHRFKGVVQHDVTLTPCTTPKGQLSRECAAPFP